MILNRISSKFLTFKNKLFIIEIITRLLTLKLLNIIIFILNNFSIIYIEVTLLVVFVITYLNASYYNVSFSNFMNNIFLKSKKIINTKMKDSITNSEKQNLMLAIINFILGIISR